MDNYKLHKSPDMTEVSARSPGKTWEIDHNILSTAKAICYNLLQRLICLHGKGESFDEALDDEGDDANHEDHDEPEDDEEDDEVDESEDYTTQQILTPKQL